MAKSKHDDFNTPDGLLLLEAWARDGLTEEEIARKCGIAGATLREWKKRYPPIALALMRGKEIADIHVENALYKKALGYSVPVKKTYKLKRVEYEGGKRVSEEEYLETVVDEVYVPADISAQKFWLTNRAQKKWGGEAGSTQADRERLDALAGMFGKVIDDAQ